MTEAAEAATQATAKPASISAAEPTAESTAEPAATREKGSCSKVWLVGCFWTRLEILFRMSLL